MNLCAMEMTPILNCQCHPPPLVDANVLRVSSGVPRCIQLAILGTFLHLVLRNGWTACYVSHAVLLEKHSSERTRIPRA